MSVALRPSTLEEALAYLADDPTIVPVAGCTDLMVSGAGRLDDFSRVLDLLGIPSLCGIREARGEIEIGAATTFTEIRRSSPIRSRLPILAQAAAVVGGWQIQNRATLGGNVANASPAGDSLPVLLALDATVVAVGPRGRREIPYEGFHVGYRQTALQPGEIIAAFRIPVPPHGTVQAFRKVGTREAQAISKVVVAMVARCEAGLFQEIRLAAGSVAPTPVRLRAAEQAVRGKAPGAETAILAGAEAAREVTPIDDVRSTADYRRFALERVVRRMVRESAP